MPPAAAPLPLSTLLSQVLVAATVEFDTQAELALPHHTTSHGAAGASADAVTPWLVSYVCWANVVQYVGPDGLTVAALRARARTDELLLGGLRRWRYLRLTPAAGAAVTTPPADTTLVRLTSHGGRAQAIWRGLPDLLDTRWREHFGDDTVERLHHALAALFPRLPIDPPAFLPVVHPAGHAKARVVRSGPPSHTAGTATTDLITLLAGVLLAFTVDVEDASRLALPITANTLRVLGPEPRRLRELPRLTGVSKEGNAMCTGLLERIACAVVEPDPGAARGKVVRLTEKGQRAQAKATRVLAATEEQWRATYGTRAVGALRVALEALVGDGTLAGSPLARAVEPAPGTWRASVRPPATLPHYPMVLHRGGYPDGS